MAESPHIICPHCGGINRVNKQRLTDNPQCGKCHQSLFTGQPLALNGVDFSRTLAKSDLPLIVDFWAPWCGPCKMFAPVFSQAAQTLEPSVRLIKINTEENQAIASQFNIRSIPTLAIFHQGKEITRMSGALNANQLTDWVKQHLPT